MSLTPSNEPAPAEVPVRAVVLFSSGVGYFEHAGPVDGDSTAELRFKTEQINDVLKSLILQDAAGKVGAVVYPSQDPLARTLRSFQVDLTQNPSLAGLLNQLRGAGVKLTLATEETAGAILGVEERRKIVGQNTFVDVWILNLLAGCAIRSVPLEDVRKLELEEPRLQQELTRALAAVAAARDQDKKPVRIQFQGQGLRDVRIGYVVETPVWKTSYRLILPEAPDPNSHPDADNSGRAVTPPGPRLQGWAIVENQTDNDWNDVHLRLVSGRPISFVQELYQPLYSTRPVVKPDLFAGLTPKTYDAGIAPADAPESFKDKHGGGGGFSPGAPHVMRMRAMAKSSPGPLDRIASAAVSMSAPAQAQDQAQDMAFRFSAPDLGVVALADFFDVGELFQYSVAGVSLPRQRSAMIPIVTDDVEIERLSIYNRDTLAKHPLTGARLKNTTGKHLLQGPITVLDAGPSPDSPLSYAGDARIDNLPPGQDRLLSYGIDLQILVQCPDPASLSTLQGGKIVQGSLWLSHKHVSVQEYLLDNKAGKIKNVIIEHPRNPAFALVETPDPVETTETLYRFMLPVPPGKSARLTVKAQHIAAESVALLSSDETQLAFFGQAAEIPTPVKDALANALSLRRGLADAEAKIQSRQEQVEEIGSEQERLRENLKAVPEKSQYHARLLNKLNEQETAIEALQKEMEALRKTESARREQLETYLAALDVD